MDFLEMMANGMRSSDESIPVKDILEEAQDFVKRYHETEEFKPGDLVVWKDGMNNKKYPKYGEPILVLETFPTARKDNDGTQYGGEPSDMRCLVKKEEDGDMCVFAFDSHCFTKYKG